MDIVVYTHHAKYKGTVETPAGVPARLQEMLNTPSMFSSGRHLLVNQILLHNATISFLAGGKVITEERPLVMVYPRAAELVYETSSTLVTRAGLSAYERQQAGREETRVEILTTGQKRLVGTNVQGLRSLTHPILEKMFFALTSVELEEFEPEPMTTEIDCVLMNYHHIESFMPVK